MTCFLCRGAQPRSKALGSFCKAICWYGNQREFVLPLAWQDTAVHAVRRERTDKVLVSGSLFQDRLCKHENFLEVHGIFEVCISAIEARLNYGER